MTPVVQPVPEREARCPHVLDELGGTTYCSLPDGHAGVHSFRADRPQDELWRVVVERDEALAALAAPPVAGGEEREARLRVAAARFMAEAFRRGWYAHEVASDERGATREVMEREAHPTGDKLAGYLIDYLAALGDKREAREIRDCLEVLLRSVPIEGEFDDPDEQLNGWTREAALAIRDRCRAALAAPSVAEGEWEQESRENSSAAAYEASEGKYGVLPDEDLRGEG